MIRTIHVHVLYVVDGGFSFLFSIVSFIFSLSLGMHRYLVRIYRLFVLNVPHKFVVVADHHPDDDNDDDNQDSFFFLLLFRLFFLVQNQLIIIAKRQSFFSFALPIINAYKNTYIFAGI